MIFKPIAQDGVTSGKGADGGSGELENHLPPPRTGQYIEFKQITENQ